MTTRRKFNVPGALAALVLIAESAFCSVANATATTAEPLAFDALDRRRDSPPNEEPYYRSDGVYGRLDGELTFAPSLGMQWTRAGWMTGFGLSAFYFHTIGIDFHMALGNASPVKPRADFTLSTLSLALRPLFLLRWSRDWEKGPGFLDLTIDSLTLYGGGYWSTQHSTDMTRSGFESGLSLGFPVIGQAHGPWLTLSFANRLPAVTAAAKSVDLVYGLRFEWALSLDG
jgi:hypothetical protein